MKARLSPTRKKFLLATAAISSTLLLGLTACTSTPTSPAANESNVATIAEGTLACASSGEYPPFSFRDTSNELVGFDIEICEAIAAELGLTAEPVTGAFNTLIAGLTSDRYDAIIGSLTATDERKTQVDFTANYYENDAVLFVQPDSEITDVADLNDATVGVALGTTFETAARELPGVANVQTYQADIDALNDLAAGRIDAVITVELGGLYAAKEAGLEVTSVGGAIIADSAAIAVNKGNTELLTAISDALATIKSNGVYEKISMTWFGKNIG